MVLAFNHRLVTAIDDNIDVTDTVAALDPDPLRYMWVDEGDGQIPAQLPKAAGVRETPPRLAGQDRQTARALPHSRNASRPTIAARGATTVVAWLEWQEDRGDRLVADVGGAGGGGLPRARGPPPPPPARPRGRGPRVGFRRARGDRGGGVG